MPELNVRDVPKTIHAILEERARSNQRNLDEEVLAILKDVLETQKSDRQAAIEEMRRMRENGPTITDEPHEVKRNHVRQARTGSISGRSCYSR